MAAIDTRVQSTVGTRVCQWQDQYAELLTWKELSLAHKVPASEAGVCSSYVKIGTIPVPAAPSGTYAQQMTTFANGFQEWLSAGGLMPCQILRCESYAPVQNCRRCVAPLIVLHLEGKDACKR